MQINLRMPACEKLVTAQFKNQHVYVVTRNFIFIVLLIGIFGCLFDGEAQSENIPLSAVGWNQGLENGALHRVDSMQYSQLVPHTNKTSSHKAYSNITSRFLILSPRPSRRNEETHSALFLSQTSYSNNVFFQGHVRTVKQLRTGSPPNPWECAWVVWNYSGNDHYYYLALKPNGWELGKRDPSYPGGQRFLLDGNTLHPVGEWTEFKIRQTTNIITITLNDIEVGSIADDERVYLSGQLGFYTEDARIEVADIRQPFRDDFKGEIIQSQRGDGHKLKNWVAPFLGYGFIAIIDRKDRR